jgi:hypothetical protein
MCHFGVWPDDITLTRVNGQCICLACYLRTAGKDAAMPRALRREIEACLATTPAM